MKNLLSILLVFASITYVNAQEKTHDNFTETIYSYNFSEFVDEDEKNLGTNDGSGEIILREYSFDNGDIYATLIYFNKAKEGYFPVKYIGKDNSGKLYRTITRFNNDKNKSISIMISNKQISFHVDNSGKKEKSYIAIYQVDGYYQVSTTKKETYETGRI